MNNLRLQQIEKVFPTVRFVARGDQLKVKGEAKKLEILQALLEAIFGEIKKRGNISEKKFSEMVASSDGRAERKQEEGDDWDDDLLILHGAGGRLIRARTKGQAKIVASSFKNDIVFAVGPAGTGKTYTAVALAVKALKEKRVKKIVLCRPAVDAGESLGFLPGDLKDKVDPYLRPLYDALEDMLHGDKLKHYLGKNVIEIVPLAYMRGRTLNNSFIILDEAQNATQMQLKMFLTRMGEHSKIIITGDDSQIDLPNKRLSGLVQCIRILKGIKGIGMIRLQPSDVVRHKLVKRILEAYEGLEKEQQARKEMKAALHKKN